MAVSILTRIALVEEMANHTFQGYFLKKYLVQDQLAGAILANACVIIDSLFLDKFDSLEELAICISTDSSSMMLLNRLRLEA